MYSMSQFHRRTGGGRNETLFNDIVSDIMGWYMCNGLEYTVILSHFLTFITGSSSRLLRIRFSADLTMYWFPVRHFRCMKICPLVIWIWNQNIAISTIVGTSSHIKLDYNDDEEDFNILYYLLVMHGCMFTAVLKNIK